MVNRIFKILTILVLLLMLGFLSIGLMVPQVEYETLGEINGTQAEVFAMYNDMDKLHNWIPSVKSIKPLKETENKKGSVYEMVIDNEGNEIKMEEKVLDYREGELVSLQFEPGAMVKTDEFTFAQAGNKTIINGKHSVKGNNYFYRCMFGLFKSNMQGIDQSYMDAFKKHFESR